MTDSAVRFRLYVAGEAPNSQRAVTNLAAFCDRYLPGRHAIEIVDVFEQPERALEDRVFLTPTLAIVAPPPVRMIVGDLSETSGLRLALRLAGDPA